MSRRSKRFISLVVLGSVFLAWFVFLAPRQVGGRAGFIMVHGPSMQPLLYTGDLVVTRSHDTYETGDVIAYRVPKGEEGAGRIVIHRIIGGDSTDGFITKGDNKEAADLWRPRPSDVIGSQWIHLPHVGDRLNWVRANIRLILIAMVGMWLVGGNQVKQRRKGGHKMKGHADSPQRAGMLGRVSGLPSWLLGGLVIAGLVAAVAGALAVVAFSRSTERTAFQETARYQQSMSFAYTANVDPSTLYPTGVVGPIQAPPSGAAADVAPPPLYTKLTRTFDITFKYAVAGEGLRDIAGAYSVDLNVTANGKGGWTNTQQLVANTPFQGNSATGSFTIDMAPIEALIARVEEETGFKPTSYDITAVPHVAISGNAAGQPVTDEYAQTFTVSMAGTTITPEATLAHRDEQTLGSQVTRHESVDAGLFSVPVRTLRLVSVPVTAVALIALAGLAFAAYEGAGQNPNARVSARYGTRFVSVAETSHDKGDVVQMTRLEDLAVLAQRDGKIIFNKKLTDGDLYFVPDGPVTYEYTDRLPVAPVTTASTNGARTNGTRSNGAKSNGSK